MPQGRRSPQHCGQQELAVSSTASCLLGSHPKIHFSPRDGHLGLNRLPPKVLLCPTPMLPYSLNSSDSFKMQINMIRLPAPASKTPCCGKDAGTREGRAKTQAQLYPAGALLSASAVAHVGPVARLVCVSLGFLPIGLTSPLLWSPRCLQAPSSWREERTCRVGSPRGPARFSAPSPSLDRQPVQSPQARAAPSLRRGRSLKAHGISIGCALRSGQSSNRTGPPPLSG